MANPDSFWRGDPYLPSSIGLPVFQTKKTYGAIDILSWLIVNIFFLIIWNGRFSDEVLKKGAEKGVFACCCHWRHFHLVSDEELATYSTPFPGYLLEWQSFRVSKKKVLHKDLRLSFDVNLQQSLNALHNTYIVLYSVNIRASMCIHLFVHTFLFLYLHMYTDTRIYIYLCLVFFYIHIYIYIIYTYSHALSPV